MTYFNVALVGAARVRPIVLMVEIVRGVLQSLAERAGKTLKLWTPASVSGATSAQFALSFSPRVADPIELRFGAEFIRPGPLGLILGIEGGVEVLVGALEELRMGEELPMGGPPQLAPSVSAGRFR